MALIKLRETICDNGDNRARLEHGWMLRVFAYFTPSARALYGGHWSRGCAPGAQYAIRVTPKVKPSKIGA